jgi:hypothetical protein
MEEPKIGKIVQVLNQAAGAAYISANPDITCFYTVDTTGGVLAPEMKGFENTGSPPTRMWVTTN